MASLKETKNRIASVRSTLKITSAMKLVASAKLRKAQAAIEGMLPYKNALILTLERALDGGSVPESMAKYYAKRESGKVVLIGFGTFAAKKRAARKGINPATKKEIKIPAKKVATFKAGSKLKAAVK